MQIYGQIVALNSTFVRRLIGFSVSGRRALFGATAVFACLLVAPADAQPNAQQGAPSVGTVYAERKPIAQTLDLVGRVEAIDRVSIQARVKGYLDAVLFKEGDFVKKDAPLYQIEKGLFQAAV